MSRTTTPPPRPNKNSKGETPPRLTPSSQSSSDGSFESTSLFFSDVKSSTKESSSSRSKVSSLSEWELGERNRKAPSDRNIIRGAAAVRESLTPAVSIPKQKKKMYSDEVTEWSDPFASVRSVSSSELDLSAMAMEEDFEDIMSKSKSTLNGSSNRGLPFDERRHWATMALVPREDEFQEDGIDMKKSVEELQADLAVLERDMYEIRKSSATSWAPVEAPPPRRVSPPTSPPMGPVVPPLAARKSLFDEDSAFGGADDNYDASLDDEEEPVVRSTTKAKPPVPPQSTEKEPPIILDSPLSKEYAALQRDPAYIHAQNAGMLWQSLVGQHVRFPKTWWSEARVPPMGMSSDRESRWKYAARHGVASDGALNHLVKSRASAGRTLLHLVVRDIVTLGPVLDIAVGVFHPNARGIRTSVRPKPELENSRFVWMALRKRGDSISLLDNLLCGGRKAAEIADESPLGPRKAVHNQNMRAVFGDQPPLHTICIQESELFQKLSLAAEIDPASANKPALMLLHEFLVLV